MSSVILQNSKLRIEVNSLGSELISIYDKKNDREVLWEADPKIWPRHAPVLFPFIGKCYEGLYRYNHEIYEMLPHGFARDYEFKQISLSENEVWYELSDNQETYKIYPFHFKFRCGHKISDGNIHVMWEVENADSKELHYMVGGHPAFRTPKGMSIYDFTLEFELKDKLNGGLIHYLAPDGNGYVDAVKEDVLNLTDNKVPVTKGFFDTVLTYIFDDNQVEKISLMLPGNIPYVTIHCENEPYLAVWTVESTHPFVCLEPWFGRADDKGYRGELEYRQGEMHLTPGDIFKSEYVVEIH